MSNPQFFKTGVVSASNTDEAQGHDLLYATLGHLTADNPYVLTGSGNDIIDTVGSKITLPTDLGNTFYLLAKCSPGWAPQHGYNANTAGKGVICYYLDKEAGGSISHYDSVACFHSNNWISEGVWRTTIDVSTYKAVGIRLNTYSDGSTSVTCKFWDIKLIPEKYYIDQSISSAKLFTDTTVAKDIQEY